MNTSVTAEEVLARLAPHERAWVIEFRDRVREELGARLKDLRIFGSKVRGEDHAESDIDLLVLVDGLDGDTDRRIHQISHTISGWLSPMVFDFEEYHEPVHRASGFYKEMRKESVRL
jgi:predicted nucleotidyltransferase